MTKIAFVNNVFVFSVHLFYTQHAGEEKERNKKNSPPMQPVFAAEVSNRKAAHLDMNPHQR